MASFYLAVRDGDALIRDPNVYRFDSAQQARDATLQLVRAMLAEHGEDFGAKQIEIADATGHAIAVLRRHDVIPPRHH